MGQVNLPTGASFLGLPAADTTHTDMGYWALDTFNPNAASSAVVYLGRTSADIVAFQETKVVSNYLIAQDSAAARIHWSLSIGEAKVTDVGGLSAGTAVATRAHIGHAVPTESGMRSSIPG